MAEPIPGVEKYLDLFIAVLLRLAYEQYDEEIAFQLTQLALISSRESTGTAVMDYGGLRPA